MESCPGGSCWGFPWPLLLSLGMMSKFIEMMLNLIPYACWGCIWGENDEGEPWASYELFTNGFLKLVGFDGFWATLGFMLLLLLPSSIKVDLICLELESGGSFPQLFVGFDGFWALYSSSFLLILLKYSWEAIAFTVGFDLISLLRVCLVLEIGGCL